MAWFLGQVAETVLVRQTMGSAVRHAAALTDESATLVSADYTRPSPNQQSNIEIMRHQMKTALGFGRSIYNDDIEQKIQLAYKMALKHGKLLPKDLSILLLGTENTGKTSLISTFLGEGFVEKRPATDGAETQIVKAYAEGWKRITTSEKSMHLYSRFIHGIENNAQSYISASPEPEDLPSLSDQDIRAISSNACAFNEDHESFNIVAWDYAGQVIFHNTHSVFMSENGVPIITFNASMKLNDEIKPRVGSPLPSECRTNISSIHYWLNTVSSMRPADRFSSGPMALLVGTHIDMLHDDIKQARRLAKRKILPHLEKELRNKPFLKQLIGSETGIMAYLDKYCFFVSNKYPDEEIERLRSTVVAIAPSLKKEEPVVFLKIEQRLLSHKQQIIQRSEVLKIATECGFSAPEDSWEFEGLLRYLHDKRTILCFSKIQLLRDLVILSPHWLAKLFSYVITAHTYATGHKHDKAWERLTTYGILGGNLFAHMVQKFFVDNPSDMSMNTDQVLAILLHFHLVAPVTTTWFTEESFPPPDDFGDTYIVPSFVHHDDGKCPPNTAQERVIYYIFGSGFVPTNLLNQLIVECICRNVRMNNQLLWMRHGKVGLQLGASQKYYISKYEAGQTQGVQLTISIDKTDVNSIQERFDLIQYIDQQLCDIMEVFMPAEKKPLKYIPCPHCTNVHIHFDKIGMTNFCTFANDKKVPTSHYTDLKLNNETGTATYCSCGTVQSKIRENYVKLTNLTITSLLPSLISNGVITGDDKEEIDNKSTRKKKMMYLLDSVIIPSLRLGYGQKYNGFIASLNESVDHAAKHLSEKLPYAAT